MRYIFGHFLTLKAALMGEHHVRIEISDFVMRTFVLSPYRSLAQQSMFGRKDTGCDVRL